VKHPSEIIKKGDKIEVVVLEVDAEKKRIALGRKQLLPQPPGSGNGKKRGRRKEENKISFLPSRFTVYKEALCEY